VIHDDPEIGDRQPPLVRSTLPRIRFGQSKRGDAIYYAAVTLAAVSSWIVALLPRFAVDRLAAFIAWLSWLKGGEYRENVCSNLSHIFDQPAHSRQILAKSKGVFRTNALNVVDLLQAPHLSPRDFERMGAVVDGSWDYFDNAARSGTGAIILTAHLGPFDFAGSAMRSRGYPMSALTARTTGRFAFHFVSFLRGSQHMRVIEASSSGLRQALRLLDQGQMLILLSDRDFFLSGRPTIFFGEETTLPIGAVRLARDTGVPIIPVFAHRRGNVYELTLRPPMTVEKTSDRDSDIAAALARVAAELEAAIARAPDQWVLFQRVWPEEHESNHRA
jgi:KDO2-lipid IV(A) lauroyltransferase